MDERILNLLLNIGSASLIPIAGAIAAWVGQKLKMQALNIKGDIFEKTQMAVKTAIFSAEQQGKTRKLSTSANKKDFAMKLAKKLLEAQKIKVNDGILSELVEAGVWESLPEVIIPEPLPIDIPKKTEEAPEIKVGDIIQPAVG